MARTAAKNRPLPALGLALVLVVLAVTGCGHAKKVPAEQLAAQAYLDALGDADSATAGQRTTDPTAATAAITRSLTGLGDGDSPPRGSLRVTGLTDRQPDSATASYDASWQLPGLSTPWRYTGSLPVVKQADGWRVSWKAGDIHPQLTDESHLVLERTQPARAALTDNAGKPLLTPTPVVTVGINPATVRDLPDLAARLAAVPALQTTAAEITSAVKAAGKDQFVPVITLRRPAYEQVKPQIYALPGTQFQSETRLLPPSADFARPLLGSIGPATAEIVEASAGKVRAGDTVGLSGLQQALDEQLRGTPGVEVYAATDADDAPGAKLGTVTSPVAGKPVRLTLDRAVQAAADATLANQALPAAVVAVQPSTGKVLAVANSASAPGDIALTGQYPAGSTFKIATYAAALQNDPTLAANTQVDCPATVTVDGRTFENENRFAHGKIPLSAAFGYSCNTTAIAFGTRLPAGALAKAAASLGLGADWTLPVPAFSGSLPATASGTEQAAESIGQGKVLVSPLLMASMAGAAATGRPVAPSLVTGKQADPGPALDGRVTSTLNELMRATVAMPGATGYAALHDLPGEIRGKTGTAEFGTDVPPKSHSWFAGVRGDLAVAVFVYGGENSTTGAVPLARQFFTALG
ncbi:penicillin-binding transpeptidase domain-containing protein [Jatrophihabitans sp.]|uniref:penicillin-binding transpeptidase domain-containing protein n=1 Tax=Jatrophihabitans sp. TaxID=1932789 RepID=UPI002D0B1F5D|nr:penicillin-binding transpeptidase domain-containing protein [Jatrophihabitans sp.]